MPRIVRRPSPSADRLSPGTLALVAIACGAAGVVLSLAVFRTTSHPPSGAPPRAEPPIEPRAPSAGEPDATTIAPREALDAGHLEPGPNAATAPAAEPAPAARAAETSTTNAPAAAADTEMAPATAKAAHVARTLVPGMVAYVKCKGAEKPHSRFPCARDRAFEDSVWQALSELGRCAQDPGRGHGEARLTVQRGGPTLVELRARALANPASRLDLRAVTKCAEPRLRSVRSALTTPVFVTAFRFELR